MIEIIIRLKNTYIVVGGLLKAVHRFYDLLGGLLLFSSSVMTNSATPWTAACQPSLSFTVSQSLLKFMFIESMMPSNYLGLSI